MPIATRAFSVLFLGVICLQAFGQATNSDDPFVAQRRALAHKERKLILNNDGCDVLYFPPNKEVTVENLLDLRTTPLAETQVDTLFYCSISSGFSYFTHNTQAGTILEHDIGDQRNITRDLIEMGTDALQVMVDFCHEHEMECFWSFRMNDTHDGAHRPDKPYPLFPPLKEQHPEYLIGSFDKRPKHGSYTSVNYGLAEIRELAFRYAEEVCQNYDVDGIELDFFRHLSYFPTPAYGGRATEEELEMMTELLRRVRAMADEEGRRRGRPILIATRVPDSVEFSRGLGLDIEKWMAEDLVDIVIGSGYFQMNPWEYLVELGHKYDRVVYAGFSESRVRGDAPSMKRNAIETYRARARRAMQAGADGIYLFNFFNPRAPMLHEIGSLETLRGKDKLYFVTVRGDTPERYLTGGEAMRKVPILTPERPAGLQPEDTYVVDLLVGDDLAAEVAEGLGPLATLHVSALGADRLAVQLNGTALTESIETAVGRDFAVDPGLVKQGENRLVITALPFAAAEADEWTTVWTAEDKPKSPWTSDRPSAHAVAELQDGALLIADRGTDSGQYMYYHYPWGISPEHETVVEVRAKVISGWNNVILCNGVATDRICLRPDAVSLYSDSKVRYAMDTTDDFHTYRIVLRGQDVLVYVDGQLGLDGTGKFTAPVQPLGRNDITFGAANSPEVGEALWQSVKLRTAGISVYDLALRVTYPKE